MEAVKIIRGTSTELESSNRMCSANEIILISDKPGLFKIGDFTTFNGIRYRGHTSGTSSQRPPYVVAGTTFFDTSLGKMIVYNGSAWVNMDGSALA